MLFLLSLIYIVYSAWGSFYLEWRGEQSIIVKAKSFFGK